MRKAQAVEVADGILRERLEPLPSTTVSTTVRLPVDVAAYLGQLIENGQARDRTDAIVRCIRRHQETQSGTADLTRIEAAQRATADQVAGLTTMLQAVQDEVSLSGTRAAGGIEELLRNVQMLMALRLYGDGEQQSSTGSSGGQNPLLPVTLMPTHTPASPPAPAPAPAQPLPASPPQPAREALRNKP